MGVPLIFPGLLDQILVLDPNTNRYSYKPAITCDQIAEAFQHHFIIMYRDGVVYRHQVALDKLKESGNED